MLNGKRLKGKTFPVKEESVLWGKELSETEINFSIFC